MPRRPGLFVVAIAALLVAPASAEQGKAPAQCRKSDRCTLSGGDADGTTAGRGARTAEPVRGGVTGTSAEFRQRKRPVGEEVDGPSS
jgi:hypothetical protein